MSPFGGFGGFGMMDSMFRNMEQNFVSFVVLDTCLLSLGFEHQYSVATGRRATNFLH